MTGQDPEKCDSKGRGEVPRAKTLSQPLFDSYFAKFLFNKRVNWMK